MFLNPSTEDVTEYSGTESIEDLEALMRVGFEWLVLPGQLVATSEVHAARLAAEECAALD